jgi:hypothetical protein
MLFVDDYDIIKEQLQPKEETIIYFKPLVMYNEGKDDFGKRIIVTRNSTEKPNKYNDEVCQLYSNYIPALKYYNHHYFDIIECWKDSSLSQWLSQNVEC